MRKVAKYMVIIWTDEGQEAFFTDSERSAENTRMDAEVGMGYYAEVYEWVIGDDDTGDRYELAWA